MENKTYRNLPTRISEDEHRQLNRIAIEEKTFICDILTDLIRKYLKKKGY